MRKNEQNTSRKKKRVRRKKDSEGKQRKAVEKKGFKGVVGAVDRKMGQD